MAKIVKAIKRKHGEGTATVEDGKYSWDYPFCRDISEKLRLGDRTLISEKLGVTPDYVGDIFNGTRYNEGVIDFALLLIEKRDELMSIQL